MIPHGILNLTWGLLVAVAVLASAQAVAGAPPSLPTNQAARSASITPSDSADLPGGITIGIWNGNATACNIAMVLANDSASQVWISVQTGALLPVMAKRVLSTGTTCSSLLALYPPS